MQANLNRRSAPHPSWRVLNYDLDERHSHTWSAEKRFTRYQSNGIARLGRFGSCSKVLTFLLPIKVAYQNFFVGGFCLLTFIITITTYCISKTQAASAARRRDLTRLTEQAFFGLCRRAEERGVVGIIKPIAHRMMMAISS